MGLGRKVVNFARFNSANNFHWMVGVRVRVAFRILVSIRFRAATARGVRVQMLLGRTHSV